MNNVEKDLDEGIASLQADIITFRDARDWKQFHTPKDLALSLVLEATEVLERFQWKDAVECQREVIENKECVAEEMGDVLNYLLIMAHDFDVDIVEACRKKLEKNSQRYSVQRSKGNHKKYTEL